MANGSRGIESHRHTLSDGASRQDPAEARAEAAEKIERERERFKSKQIADQQRADEWEIEHARLLEAKRKALPTIDKDADFADLFKRHDKLARRARRALRMLKVENQEDFLKSRLVETSRRLPGVAEIEILQSVTWSLENESLDDARDDGRNYSGNVPLKTVRTPPPTTHVTDQSEFLWDGSQRNWR